MNHQGAARDATSVHFYLSIGRTYSGCQIGLVKVNVDLYITLS